MEFRLIDPCPKHLIGGLVNMRLGGWLCVCDLWPGDRGFCSFLFYCLMGLPKTSVWFWYIWGWEDDCVCVTSGQVIEVFVLFFFIILWGCQKHLFGFDIYLRLGGWLCVWPLARWSRFLFSSFYYLVGLPKTSVWFWYIFEDGRVTVCVCDLWPGDWGWLPALHLRGRPPVSNRRTPPPTEHCQGTVHW